MDFKKNHSFFILTVSAFTVGFLGIGVFFYLRSQETALEKRLVNENRFMSAAPLIRKELDDLMTLKPVLDAYAKSPILDPILNGDRYFAKNFTGDIYAGDPEPVVRQQTYDLLAQTLDWSHSPVIGLVLDTRLLQVNNLEKFSYWSPVSTHLKDDRDQDKKSENNKTKNLNETPREPLPPNLKAMDTWVKLRLRSGDYFPYLTTQNIREVYQLSILALTSQQLPLVLSGFKWLDWLQLYIERSTLNHASPLLPKPTDNGHITNYTRTVWGTVGLIDWAVKEKVFVSVFPHPERYFVDSLLLCTALNERLPGISFEFQFLENDYADAFARFKTRVNAISPFCRPSPSVQKWDQMTNGGPTGKSKFLAKVSALILMNLARPNYLERYITPI